MLVNPLWPPLKSLGVFPRLTATLSGLILLTFGVTMALALGMKASLDASVFSASAGAFLIACVPGTKVKQSKS